MKTSTKKMSEDLKKFQNASKELEALTIAMLKENDRKMAMITGRRKPGVSLVSR